MNTRSKSKSQQQNTSAPNRINAVTSTRSLDSSGAMSSLGDTSKSGTASTNTKPDDGYNRTNSNLRSVLMHPIGLALTAFLNDKPTSDLGDDYWNIFGQEVDVVKKEYDDLKNIYESYTTTATTANTEWDQTSEKSWSKMHVTAAGNCFTTHPSTFSIKLTREKEINNGRIDVIITKNTDSQSDPQSVVSIVEFGMSNEDWWKKQDQFLNYLDLLLQNNDNNVKEKYKFDQPILLVVNTARPTKKRNIDEPHQHQHQHKPIESRVGVFLCTRKKNGFRIALLWRKNMSATCEAETKAAFIKVCCASQFLAKFRNDEHVTNYEYLGPNCCRIDDKVYRCYDTRFHTSERRPDLYLNPDLQDVIGGDASRFLELHDEQEGNIKHVTLEQLDVASLSQNQNDQTESVNPLNWMWQFRGRLLVISIPYYDGKHYATQPSHFLPIIDQLELLHLAGFVHGDIRAYNMVFQHDKDTKGWLIDFDFGGPVNGDTTRYPVGYKNDLPDGTRLGSEREAITVHHDWYALSDIMFSLHSWNYNDRVVMQHHPMILMGSIINNFRRSSTSENGSEDEFRSSASDYAKRLREFIAVSIDNKCNLDVAPRFYRDLLQCGMLSAGQGKNPSNNATGSPPKKE